MILSLGGGPFISHATLFIIRVYGKCTKIITASCGKTLQVSAGRSSSQEFPKIEHIYVEAHAMLKFNDDFL